MSVSVREVDDKKIEDIIYFVKSGDTLQSVADKFCVNLIELINDNDLDKNSTISEGDILWVKKRNSAIHIVKPLETIEEIAKKYNVTTEHIKTINGITKVFIGQKIII